MPEINHKERLIMTNTAYRHESIERLNTVCAYAGQVVMYSRICNACPDFLETCVPRVGKDGYIHGECDMYYCECCGLDSCAYQYSY
jgi:hypothetical protein